MCLFWRLGKVYSETGLLRVILILLLVFQQFFYFLICKNLFPVSCEFLKGKKIECVLIIGYLISRNYLQNGRIFCQFLQVFQKKP